eukprot:115885-Pelagomonas_calceolata.AAC.3
MGSSAVGVGVLGKPPVLLNMRALETPPRRKGKKKLCRQKKNLPTFIEEKETQWLRRAVSLRHHKATDLEVLMGTWRDT